MLDSLNISGLHPNYLFLENQDLHRKSPILTKRLGRKIPYANMGEKKSIMKKQIFLVNPFNGSKKKEFTGTLTLLNLIGDLARVKMGL